MSYIEDIEKEASTKIKEGYENLKEEASQFSEKAQEGVKYVKDRMGKYQENSKEFLDDMSDYIKENPQQSALIAGGVGAVFGIIFGLLLRGGRH